MKELLEIFKPLMIFSASLIVLVIVIDYIRYKTSSYYKLTHNPYITIYLDLGKRGEYLTYNKLRYLEKSGSKILFNLYLNKENGETTETDILMIHKKAAFVIESKNYSGWIFGSESSQMWTQTLPQGKGNVSKKEKILQSHMAEQNSHKIHIGKASGKPARVFSYSLLRTL